MNFIIKFLFLIRKLLDYKYYNNKIIKKYWWSGKIYNPLTWFNFIIEYNYKEEK